MLKGTMMLSHWQTASYVKANDLQADPFWESDSKNCTILSFCRGERVRKQIPTGQPTRVKCNGSVHVTGIFAKRTFPVVQ